MALAQCTLASPTTWTHTGIPAGWSGPGNWAPSVVPNSAGTNVCITSAGTSTAVLDIPTNVASLQVGSGNVLNTNAGTNLQVNGGQIINGGLIGLNGALQLNNSLTLSGTGTFTMSGPASGTGGQIGTNGNNFTLTNQSTIAGSGLIGSNITTFGNLNLDNGGTINGNSTVDALQIGGNGGVVANHGTMEATAGGTLILAPAAAINNLSGTILSSGAGSTVIIQAVIQGGNLTTSSGGVIQTAAGGATLDAVSQGAITLTNGSTYTSTAGTTFIKGTLNLGTTAASTLTLGGALELAGDTTLSGGAGAVVNITGNASNSTGGQIGTNGSNFTLTNNVAIQGSGTIGSNLTTFQNLNLINNGTINANTSGQILTIQGTGGTITNAGLFEATGGGILNLATSNPINNSAGNITANGGTVNVSTTIQGGNLTTSAGGVMQTTAAGATLDAATLGAITLTNGSTYTSTAGTTFITGTLNLGTTAGSTLTLGGALELAGNTTLSGGTGAVVNITGNAANSTGGQIGTNGSNFTLTNNVAIQGSGTIGSNLTTFQNLNLINNGTINANTSGQILTIQGTGGTITNAGLFEATGGGILNLATSNPINNSAGNITANGVGSTVNLSTTIQGGTVNTVNGGVVQTVGTSTLDGIANGAITISDGSTVTSGAAALTRVTGTLNLGTTTGGTLALTGQMQLIANTTLAGPGAINIAGGQIGTNGNAWLLTNQATIRGTGIVGSNVGALFSNGSVSNQGFIIANGGTLTVAETGGLTNTGTLQADASALLHVSAPLSNFSAGTLTGGTYVMNNGTVQVDSLGNTGGEIVHNGATIRLTGVNSNLFDSASNDALSAFTDNQGIGSFTILGGRNFFSAGNFGNAGIVDIGAGSAFTATNGDGTAAYSQSGGTTQVDGTLTASNGVNINGGTLKGTGTVVANVTNAGHVAPGDSPGTLSVTGNYTQTSAGALDIEIGGTGTGQFDFLNITGAANLAGILNALQFAGFQAAAGEVFDILHAGSRIGTFLLNSTALNLAPGLTASLSYSSTDVFLNINGAVTSTPEPGTLAMFGSALLGLGLLRKYRQK